MNEKEVKRRVDELITRVENKARKIARKYAKIIKKETEEATRKVLEKYKIDGKSFLLIEKEVQRIIESWIASRVNLAEASVFLASIFVEYKLLPHSNNEKETLLNFIQELLEKGDQIALKLGIKEELKKEVEKILESYRYPAEVKERIQFLMEVLISDKLELSKIRSILEIIKPLKKLEAVF